MPVTLPLEVFEALEKGLGKEEARTVVKSIEAAISEATEYKWATTKEELLDAIRKEFVTKDVFEERINALKTELLAEIKKDRAELLGIMKQDKAELLGIIKQDKAELLGIMKQDKAELLGIMKQDKAELMEKIENVRVALDRKFTIMFVILFFTVIFLNQNALEFMFKVLRLIR